MRFILKRRIYPSLFVHKAFTKLPKQSLEQAFCQIRADYVEKNLLKDVCAPEDVVYFGALILKVKLQGKLLRSKSNRISADLLRKHIDYGVPSYFIERDGITTRAAREPSHWAERIEEQYFQKKEFADYSLADAQEKFLSGIGLYNSMFSSYYVLQKEASDRREGESRSLMNQLAARRFIGRDAVSSEGASEEDSGSSARSSSRKRPLGKHADHTIHEASSRDEFSGSDDSEDPSEQDGRKNGSDRQD